AAGGAYEMDLALEVEAGDARLDKRPGGEIVLDGGAGDERNSVAAAHGARHRLLQPELQADVEVAEPRAGAAQLVLDHLPHACTFLHHDQLLGSQVVESDGPSCERMAGRASEDDGVADERLVLDAAMARRR